MRKGFVSVAVLLGLATLPASAQNDLGTPVITPPMLEQPARPQGVISQAEPAPPAPSQAAQPAAPAAAAAAPAEPAEPATADPVVARTETIDDWNVECFDRPVDGISCQISHRVVAGANSQVVLALAIAGAAEADPLSLQLALPLGISLRQGATLSLGEGYQNAIPISRCNAQGCIIEGNMTPELAEEMRAARTASITVYNDRGAPVEIPFSLMGFTAALTEMYAENAASQ